ncbi:MAG: hypothetical protein ACRDRW_18575 [Pseudonocardiaceae bacterium]
MSWPASAGGGSALASIDVSPADLYSVSKTFASGQDQLESILGTLSTALDGCAGMAGDDDTGHKFASKYDPVAAALINVLAAAVGSVGGMSTGLVTTANNYVQAEHHSTAGSKPYPVYFPPPFVLESVVCLAAPSSAVGPGSGGLPGPLSKYWPNGHQDMLRRAADALRTASSDLQNLGNALHGAVNSITDSNSSASVDAMAEFWSLIWTDGQNTKAPLSAAHQACDQLAQFCEKYADAIDKAHSSIEDALVGAGIAICVTSLIGGLFTLVTGGASDVAAAELDVAEASAILGPAMAEFTTEVSAELEAAYITEIVPMLEAAAEATPSLEAAEAAETADVGATLEEELAATEAREPARVGARGGGDSGGGGKPPTGGGGRGTPQGAGGPEPWNEGGDDPALVADKIRMHQPDREVPGVDDADVPQYLEDIMRQPGYKMRPTPGGTPRMGWWDPDTGTMVIREGNKGTFMQPDRGYAYFREQISE